MTTGRRRVRSSMKRPSERRAAPHRLGSRWRLRPRRRRATPDDPPRVRAGPRLGCVDPAADDLGAGDELTGSGIDRDDDDDDTSSANAPDAHTPCRCRRRSRRRTCSRAGTARRSTSRPSGPRSIVAVLAHEDVGRATPASRGELRVVHEMPVLTVHRDEPLGLQQVEHELQPSCGVPDTCTFEFRSCTTSAPARCNAPMTVTRSTRSRDRAGADDDDVARRSSRTCARVPPSTRALSSAHPANLQMMHTSPGA
jgi:hypothetical protein